MKFCMKIGVMCALVLGSGLSFAFPSLAHASEETWEAAFAEEAIKTIDVRLRTKVEIPLLTQNVVADALLQAPPAPESGFTGYGPSRIINWDREAYAFSIAGVPGRCEPSSKRCIEFILQRRVRPMLGEAGWCNPPFVNIAVQSTGLWNENSVLIEAHGAEDMAKWKIDIAPRHMNIVNTPTAIAVKCPGAYIAVVDNYWTGFDYPLARHVLHLAPGNTIPEPKPACVQKGKFTRSCFLRVFDTFGRPATLDRFASIEKLYENPPSAAEQKQILAALATQEPEGAGPEQEPKWSRFDEPDRYGWMYTGWDDDRIEIGCAGPGFGAFSSAPYAMLSVPVKHMRGSRLFAFLQGRNMPFNARISYKFGNSGGATRIIDYGLAGGVDTKEGRRFAALVPLNDPGVRKLLAKLSEGKPLTRLGVQFLPPEGDTAVHVTTEVTLDADEILKIVNGCKP